MTIIAKREEASQIFAIHLLMKNRALHEPEGKTGIADFTHRMLLKGTALMDSVEFAIAMKEVGAKAKVIDNPYIPYDDYYTSPLYSYIRFEVLSENHLQGLKLLREIVFHPSFPEGELSKVASEMDNVIKKNQEKLSTKAKNAFLSEIFSMTVPGSSVSKLGNSVYGTHETISSITGEDLHSFHQSYFSPQNMIVSVVSNIPVESVMKSMDEIFGTIRRYEGEPVTMPTILPMHTAKRNDVAGGKQQSYVYAGYLTQMSKEDLTALSVANSILSDRMAFQLREKQGLAYRVGSTIKLYGNAALFYASIGTRPENIEKAEEGILKEIASFADSELAEKELEKTINSMIGRYAMRRVPGINRAYFLGLSEFQGLGYAHDLDFVNRIKEVDKEHIKKAAKKYFDTSKVILSITR
jgi:predicted Zn-dependent peptidase